MMTSVTRALRGVKLPTYFRAIAPRKFLASHLGLTSAAWRTVFNVGPSRSALEAEFLAPAESVKFTPSSPTVRRITGMMLSAIAIAVLWAFFSETDIIVKAPAKIVVLERTQTLSAPETAVVSAIHVRDGQTVVAGQLLLELDAGVAQAEVNKFAQLLLRANVQAAVAAGLADAVQRGQLHVFPVPDNADATVWSAGQVQLRIQHADFLARLARADSDIQKYESLLSVHEQRASDQERLLQAGYVSRHAWLEREQLRLETRAQLSDARHQREALIARTLREANDTLQENQRSMVAYGEDLRRASVLLKRLQIRAPMSGTVQQLAAYTVGGVVGATQALLNLVPHGARFELVAQLDNRDAGFVRVGQTARVRLDAFDYTRYGLLEATVLDVSQDAIEAANVGTDGANPAATGAVTSGFTFRSASGSGYRVRLSLDANPPAANSFGLVQAPLSPEPSSQVYSNQVPSNHAPSNQAPSNQAPSNQAHVTAPRFPLHSLRAGLSGTVDIHTGRRRVIDFFLSPFQRSAHESLRER